MQYSDAKIEVLDEYVEGICVDGVITICKDVCDMLVLPATCSNDNEPIEVCETYASEKGYGICELADLHSNTDYINDGFKYSNAGIEVIDEVVAECGDGFITVCKHVCDEVKIRVISYDMTDQNIKIEIFDESISSSNWHLDSPKFSVYRFIVIICLYLDLNFHIKIYSDHMKSHMVHTAYLADSA